ncbi:mechanosensitive ion channel domain-containing protein [Chondrinema litorale]|uniref:mechanosensitive ion channel domain-containing protein n=1 Tax=Chondrinema litorale TaxID=2994555 RepID=UPI002543A17F|nr:mechanosensitive ion channel domain-containing protein [Chondrinema litorale]UZR93529.1 mechanosensitive ion channel [Chondrinema litorale]
MDFEFFVALYVKYGFQISVSVLLIIFYILGKTIFSKIIFLRAHKKEFDVSRALYIRKLINNILLLLCLVLVGATWDVSIKHLSIYFASFFTVAGIGLFAQWSVLSNVTSSLILYFYFPIRIGEKIQIIDGGQVIQGVILDITLFSVKIQDENGNEIYFPNNVAIQKGIVSIKQS